MSSSTTTTAQPNHHERHFGAYHDAAADIPLYTAHLPPPQAASRPSCSHSRKSPRSAAAQEPDQRQSELELTPPSQERIGKLIEVGRVVMHYGYIPMILYLGTADNPSASDRR
ncbi:mitochondrial import receptor subunit TOM7 [Microdochium nivale]|nr:mitochondrial import receptor subunit TOM7 [Microdochium nivale]